MRLCANTSGAAMMIAVMVVGLVLTTKIFMSGLDGPRESKLLRDFKAPMV